ncbi:hypothetical protein ABCS02_13895 [Microbacterium sp. X-17]|uniref:hypothetical protein n=1 Tax=Microbacterium sp. X-17 TaxID=3144404 RepID=UPI0031F5C98D
MSTTLTPETPAPAPDAPPPVRSSSRVVAIVAIAIGVLAVLATLITAALPVAFSGISRTDTVTASATGAQRVVIDASAASIRIAFGDVKDAELRVTGFRGADGWSLTRTGGELRVGADRGGLGPGALVGFGGWWGRSANAVLTLPRALDGRLDGALSVAGGVLQVDGGFRALTLDVAGGSVDVNGAATSVTLDLRAGSATVAVSGARTADVSVEAGAADVRLTGSAPDRVSVSATAGSATVRLPDATYAVTRSVTAGNLDNRLDTSATSPHAVSVNISGGYVELTPTS